MLGRVRRWSFRNIEESKVRASRGLFQKRTLFLLYLKRHNPTPRSDLVDFVFRTFPPGTINGYSDRDSCRAAVSKWIENEKIAGTIVEEGEAVMLKQRGGVGIASDTLYGVSLGLLIMSILLQNRISGLDTLWLFVLGGTVLLGVKVFYDGLRVLKVRA